MSWYYDGVPTVEQIAAKAKHEHKLDKCGICCHHFGLEEVDVLLAEIERMKGGE